MCVCVFACRGGVFVCLCAGAYRGVFLDVFSCDCLLEGTLVSFCITIRDILLPVMSPVVKTVSPDPH